MHGQCPIGRENWGCVHEGDLSALGKVFLKESRLGNERTLSLPVGDGLVVSCGPSLSFCSGQRRAGHHKLRFKKSHSQETGHGGSLWQELELPRAQSLLIRIQN